MYRPVLVLVPPRRVVPNAEEEDEEDDADDDDAGRGGLLVYDDRLGLGAIGITVIGVVFSGGLVESVCLDMDHQ